MCKYTNLKKNSVMGFFDNILGNATEVKLSEIQHEFASILVEGETLETAFKIFRDIWVFTNKRLIMQNTQGITGAKREYHSIPYKSITHFSIETAGTFDDDCEMKIWISGSPTPYQKEFKKDINIKGIQQALASHVLK